MEKKTSKRGKFDRKIFDALFCYWELVQAAGIYNVYGPFFHHLATISMRLSSNHLSGDWFHFWISMLTTIQLYCYFGNIFTIFQCSGGNYQYANIVHSNFYTIDMQKLRQSLLQANYKYNLNSSWACKRVNIVPICACKLSSEDLRV